MATTFTSQLSIQILAKQRLATLAQKTGTPFLMMSGHRLHLVLNLYIKSIYLIDIYLHLELYNVDFISFTAICYRIICHSGLWGCLPNSWTKLFDCGQPGDSMAVLGYVPCCIVGWRLTLVTHRAVGLQALCRGLSGSAAPYISCCTLRPRPVELWSHLNINLSYFSILFF